MGKYFPIAKQEQIFDFLDDSNGDYKAKCNGFYEYLFLIRSEDQKKFGDALLALLFTKEYQQTHTWPNVTLVLILFYLSLSVSLSLSLPPSRFFFLKVWNIKVT